MKLGKLLAAGKSIMNGRVEVSYRTSKQIYLPKFGPARNPFKTETAEPAAENTDNDARASLAAREAAIKPAIVSAALPAKPGPTRLASPATSPAVSTGNGAVTAQKISTSPAGLKKKANWPFSPASIFRTMQSKAHLKPSGGAGRADKPAAMQAELSLDSVKVVHNDLTDVDVEVVPIKSRSGPPESPAARKSWEAIGERLFGVEAT